MIDEKKIYLIGNVTEVNEVFGMFELFDVNTLMPAKGIKILMAPLWLKVSEKNLFERILINGLGLYGIKLKESAKGYIVTDITESENTEPF